MSYNTPDEFKAAVGVEDTVDDANIQRALDAAFTLVNNYCGRNFVAQATTPSAIILDPDPSTAGGAAQSVPFSWFYGAGWLGGYDRLRVPDVGAVTLIELDLNLNGSFDVSIPPGNWILYPLNVGQPWVLGNYTEIRLRPTSPYAFWPGYQVRVTGLWGWPTADAPPDPVRQAELILANRLFRRPSAPFGVWEAPQFGSLAALPLTDPDVVRLLDPYTATNQAPNWVAV